MLQPVVYVHQTRAIPYAEAIVEGLKPVETRTRDTLQKLVGQRVAIARTRDGHPTDIVGYVTITGKTWHTADELDTMRDETLIPPGSRFDCTGPGKWCYHLSDPERCTPVILDPSRIVRSNRSYAIIDAPESTGRK